jgi:16S rRNA (uracil1498-N3)-methyltransferase
VPELAAVRNLAEWLRGLAAVPGEQRCVLSPRAAQPLPSITGPAIFLSGPEGGLSEAEVALAVAAGFAPVGLGPRVLRADTAPLAVLAHLALSSR